MPNPFDVVHEILDQALAHEEAVAQENLAQQIKNKLQTWPLVRTQVCGGGSYMEARYNIEKKLVKMWFDGKPMTMDDLEEAIKFLYFLKKDIENA